MTSLKGAARRKRNLLARKVKEDRLYHKRIVPDKKKYKRNRKVEDEDAVQ